MNRLGTRLTDFGWNEFFLPKELRRSELANGDKPEEQEMKYRQNIEGVDIELPTGTTEVVSPCDVRGWAKEKGFLEDLDAFQLPPTLVKDALRQGANHVAGQLLDKSFEQALAEYEEAKFRASTGIQHPNDVRVGVDWPEETVREIQFEGDNFSQRRASQSGAGVAYDPESLLTGEEIAAGLDYDCPRVWQNHATKQAAQTGEIPTRLIPSIAPRRKVGGEL